MRTRIIMALAAGICVGLFLRSSPAQALSEGFVGLFKSYEVSEEYEISIGVDSLGNHRKPVRQNEIRQHFNVPGHYGRLVEITQSGSSSILWFVDESGLVRNSILSGTDTQGYRVQPFVTSRYEAEVISSERGSDLRDR